MTKTHPSRTLGKLLLFLALCGLCYAFFFMSKTAQNSSEKCVIFQSVSSSISARQEAVIMTSGLLFALGLFCILPRRRIH